MPPIEMRNVSFKYRGTTENALTNITTVFNSGEMVGIWGVNGSGKSTLFSCINGLIPHFHAGDLTGEVQVKGRLVKDTLPGQLAFSVGTVLQDFENQIIGLEVEEEVAFGLDNQGISVQEITQRVDEALDIMGLGGYRKRLMQQLSGGQKQKVILAGVIASRAEILLLDEPTSALDTLATASIYQYLKDRQQERTIVIASQKLSNILPFVNRLIVLEQGKITFDGAPAEFIELCLMSRENQGRLDGIPSVSKLSMMLRTSGESVRNMFCSVDEARKWILAKREGGLG